MKARVLTIILSSVLLGVLFLGYFAVTLIRPEEAPEAESVLRVFGFPLVGCLLGNQWLPKLPYVFKALSKAFPTKEE